MRGVALDALLVGMHVSELTMRAFPLGTEEAFSVELHSFVVYLVTGDTAGAG